MDKSSLLKRINYFSGDARQKIPRQEVVVPQLAMVCDFVVCMAQNYHLLHCPKPRSNPPKMRWVELGQYTGKWNWKMFFSKFEILQIQNIGLSSSSLQLYTSSMLKGPLNFFFKDINSRAYSKTHHFFRICNFALSHAKKFENVEFRQQRRLSFALQDTG